MVSTTVRLAIPNEHRVEVLRTLRILRGHATARLGCAAFSVVQDVTNAEMLTISERWATREALDEHVRSAEYRLLLAIIDLSSAPPDISFDTLAHIGGLDLIHVLRGQLHTP